MLIDTQLESARREEYISYLTSCVIGHERHSNVFSKHIQKDKQQETLPYFDFVLLFFLFFSFSLVSGEGKKIARLK